MKYNYPAYPAAEGDPVHPVILFFPEFCELAWVCMPAYPVIFYKTLKMKVLHIHPATSESRPYLDKLQF